MGVEKSPLRVMFETLTCTSPVFSRVESLRHGEPRTALSEVVAPAGHHRARGGHLGDD